MDNTLYVIAVTSNPIGYQSRIRLFNDFCDRVEAAKGDVLLVKAELAYDDQVHILTDDHEPYDIQLRAKSLLWHKENMINIAMKVLPPDWEYVAWVDTDITFINPSWVDDTIEALQKYQWVQMFAKALDLGPDGMPMKTFSGFCYKYLGNGSVVPARTTTGNLVKDNGGVYSDGEFWHPGYAWAARREAIDSIGGLMEFPVLGSADHLMALSLVGEADRISSMALSPGYLGAIRAWQSKALEHIDQQIGYVPGMIAHHYHGKKSNRGYSTRTQTLIDFQFDPSTDLTMNDDGVLELQITTDRQFALSQALKEYFVNRREDER